MRGAWRMWYPLWTVMVATLKLLVGKSSNGQPVFEEVVAVPEHGGCFRLLRSPGLAQGIAAGDTFEVDGSGGFKVLKRGGNVAIQIFVTEKMTDVEREASRRLEPLGASLDGKTTKQIVYTVPVKVGFPALEMALRGVVDRYPSVEWFYGNVYDSKDGTTPLGWWQDA
jgi:hypothetical protein